MFICRICNEKEFEYWTAKVNEEAEKLVKGLDEANEVLRELRKSTGELLKEVEDVHLQNV